MPTQIHYIYIVFAKNSVYVGRTRDLVGRMTSHGMLWCDWAVLETTNSTCVREREAHWVKHFVDLGCEVLNRDKDCRDGLLGHSPETRLKMSQATRGVAKSETHKNNLSKAKTGVPGPVWSEESKSNQSQKMKGNKNGLGGKNLSIEGKLEASKRIKSNPDFLRWQSRKAAAVRWGLEFNEPRPNR